MRGCVIRLRYRRLVRTVLAIQSAARRYLLRRQQAAIVIQKATRMWLAKRQEELQHRSATKIQVTSLTYELLLHT